MMKTSADDVRTQAMSPLFIHYLSSCLPPRSNGAPLSASALRIMWQERCEPPYPVGRYCNASANWATPMVSAAARSAMVRETLSIR